MQRSHHWSAVAEHMHRHRNSIKWEARLPLWTRTEGNENTLWKRTSFWCSGLQKLVHTNDCERLAVELGTHLLVMWWGGKLILKNCSTFTPVSYILKKAKAPSQNVGKSFHSHWLQRTSIVASWMYSQRTRPFTCTTKMIEQLVVCVAVGVQYLPAVTPQSSCHHNRQQLFIWIGHYWRFLCLSNGTSSNIPLLCSPMARCHHYTLPLLLRVLVLGSQGVQCWHVCKTWVLHTYPPHPIQWTSFCLPWQHRHLMIVAPIQY